MVPDTVASTPISAPTDTSIWPVMMIIAMPIAATRDVGVARDHRVEVVGAEEARVDRRNHREQHQDGAGDHHFLPIGGDEAAQRAALGAEGWGGGFERHAAASIALRVIGGADRLGGGVGAIDGGGQPATMHHQHAVAHAEDFGQLARDHQDGHAFAGEPGHQCVDLGLGANIDAARRLVHDEDARRGFEPLTQHDLLLVAAGELPHHLRRAARPHAELLDRVGGAAGSVPTLMKMPFVTLCSEAMGVVLRDGHRAHEALEAAVLRHIGDAQVAGLLGRADGAPAGRR